MKRETVEFWKNFGANWSSLLYANFILSPFCLPLAAWIVICQCYSSLVIRIGESVSGTNLIVFGGLLPTTLIYFAGLAGYVFTVKGVVFDKRGDVKQLFKEGFKANWARSLFCGFTVWASLSVAVSSVNFWLGSDFDWLIVGPAAAISFLQSLAFIPAAFLSMAQNVFFTDSPVDTYKNSFKILFLKPYTILASALSLLPVAVTVVLPFVAQLSMWVLYIFLFTTFSVVFFLLPVKKIFDGLVGKKDEEI